MRLVDPNSLAETLGNINDALLGGAKLSAADRNEAAEWIAARLDAPRSYRGLPAPTGRDYSTRLRLYTGETIGSHAGTGCKLGFEATWALTVLRPSGASVRRAAETSRQRVLERFAQETSRRRGMYCCCSCSVAGWRALGVTDNRQAGELLESGLATLRRLRNDKGRWEKYPFWYTVLALGDMERDSAVAELRHARAALERALRGREKADRTARRRRLLAERVLERVGR